jgi:hypothetical protein
MKGERDQREREGFGGAVVVEYPREWNERGSP